MAKSISWLLSLLLGVGMLADVGLRVNTSPSIPEGLYWQTVASMHIGSYVLFCPPPSPIFNLGKQRDYFSVGFCPGGYGYVLKQVAAMAGDVIKINAQGVRVNQQLCPASRPLAMDGLGRSLPQLKLQHKLHGHELLLMTDHSPTAFDARYFGVITPTYVHVLQPLLTWET